MNISPHIAGTIPRLVMELTHSTVGLQFEFIRSMMVFVIAEYIDK